MTLVPDEPSRDDVWTQVSLLERLQNRSDDEAWSRFDALYRTAIESFLRGRGLDVHEASDVCQEVMLVVHRHLPAFQHNGRTGAFRAWLKKVTATTLARVRRKSHRREHQARLTYIEQQLADDSSDLSQIWNREHDTALVELLISSLANRVNGQWLTIFRRTFVEGVPAERVASELGITKNAVLVAKSKTLKQARELGRFLLDE